MRVQKRDVLAISLRKSELRTCIYVCFRYCNLRKCKEMTLVGLFFVEEVMFSLLAIGTLSINSPGQFTGLETKRCFCFPCYRYAIQTVS